MILTPIPPSGKANEYEIETVHVRKDLDVTFVVPSEWRWAPTEQGQRLRARRLEHGLSHRDAGDRVGLVAVEWSRIESGRASVSDEDFARLLAALEE